MFAAGWIIDADTREVVWEMTMDNTSGREENRTCEDEVKLKTGIVMKCTMLRMDFPPAHLSGTIPQSISIGREGKSRNKFDKFLKWFDDDYSSLYDDIHGTCTGRIRILLSVPAGEEKSVQHSMHRRRIRTPCLPPPVWETAPMSVKNDGK